MAHEEDALVSLLPIVQNAQRSLMKIQFWVLLTIGGSKGAQGTPLGRPNSFDFMQFSRILGKIVCCPPPLGKLAPTPQGNPVSNTANIVLIH